MTLFYIGALVLVFLGLVFALWPFIQSKLIQSSNDDIDPSERCSANVTLYRDHLAELDRSLAQGTIEQAQYDQLKQELERNLLEDNIGEGSEDLTESTSKGLLSPSIYTLCIVVVVPLMAVIFYHLLGNASAWQLKETLDRQGELEQQLSRLGGNPAIERELDELNRQIVSDLHAHVAKRPKDLESKILLARSAVSINQFDKAIEAYQQIIEQEPQAAQMMAELAQAVFLQANNRAVPVVGMLAERALSIQPRNPTALGLMGVFSFQNEQYANAIQHWETALGVYPPNSPNARALQNGITQARAKLGSEAGTTAGQSNAVAKNDPHENIPAKIKVAVSFGAQVPVKPEYTVFIYARAWKGARVPLAITRVTAAQLPLTVELNDTMAMAPGMNLSSAEQVEIIARMSPSGNAITQPDDWLVSIGPLKPRVLSETVYPLIISQPVTP
ncbi:MAG: c-type cytochrome biogenesis protein CcmI [Cellvibrionaceae bacterium]